MRSMKSIVRSAAKYALERRARVTLEKLMCHEDPTVRLLAQAMSDAIGERLSAEEKGLVRRLEDLRDSLKASAVKIEIIDYGAGDPKRPRGDEEMRIGQPVISTIGEVCMRASKPALWSLLLFKLIRCLRPTRCLELGTCLGVSAAYQAAALNLNGGGGITTLEGSESLSNLARKHLRDLGLENATVVTGRFEDTLDGVLRENAPIDYAFIDGHHAEMATRHYFEKILPWLSARAILVFDDISWSDGMQRAWNSIQQHDKVRISVNMRQIGICVLDASIKGKASFRVWLL